ncbi:pyrimidine (deoxy)nucleoside triphosphate diphosphatase [Edwardsiella piscicida]|uniref:pyrimidine (deoxy)nucleoside triphosphate diphosphatase n=1 Tax=Edwardsiella piscicida TaxID=1263550 RepID=UPI0002C15504|nr:pyrimidine (deoxy)nucleoside triphosphate diphosphatase [Edwardsiella piscicida]AGH73528.1 pyrimidine (deoxy)nucleoside triphosphate pyrophosphohydrolase [Edwardsiella piscicida C07-087]EKS7779210.1 pyrimidine (deoxy)nucleoside triphosphate diphosphatase [Edwardsiella piscicida]EKS7782630.1 pyrimidine (deoxy)nucleoside triphosphate diphosphatase [Edwardsiella piscicida]UCQ25772.1 pyrimidine (deoxy)nucleoside triphosphate diphosphatase [Edwardsiella piscicida]UCQ35916.1 pyrimidine (deoxy)nuc
MSAQTTEKILHVVAAIIERRGAILLAQRGSGQDQAGLWEFPGGKVEAGESQPQALQRELDEELGLRCRVSDYVASSTLHLPGKRIHLHAWRVEPEEGEPEAREHAALCWVTPCQAQTYDLAPADRPLLQAYLDLLARFHADA